jgi:exodeoxyribonuclease VII large subunit
MERLRWRLAEVQRARLSLEAATLVSMRQRLERRAPDLDLARARTRLDALRAALRQHGNQRLSAARAPVADALARIERAAGVHLSSARNALQMRAGRLDGLSPLRVMSRGYAVVYRREDGHLVRRAGELEVGTSVRLRWAPPGCKSLSSCDEADATITRVDPGGEE